MPSSINFVVDRTMASPELVAVGFERGREGPQSLRSVQPASSSNPKPSGGVHPRPAYVARCASGSGVGHLYLSMQQSLPSKPEIRKDGKRRPAAKPASTCGRAIAEPRSHGPGRPTVDPSTSQRTVRDGGGSMAHQRPQRSATGSSGLASSIRPSRTSGAKGPRGART